MNLYGLLDGFIGKLSIKGYYSRDELINGFYGDRNGLNMISFIF